MALPFAISLFGTASTIVVLIVAGAYVLGVGLRGMSERGLSLTHRRTIGRYMLVGVAMLLLVGVVIAVVNLRGDGSTTAEPPNAQLRNGAN